MFVCSKTKSYAMADAMSLHRLASAATGGMLEKSGGGERCLLIQTRHWSDRSISSNDDIETELVRDVRIRIRTRIGIRWFGIRLGQVEAQRVTDQRGMGRPEKAMPC